MSYTVPTTQYDYILSACDPKHLHVSCHEDVENNYNNTVLWLRMSVFVTYFLILVMIFQSFISLIEKEREHDSKEDDETELFEKLDVLKYPAFFTGQWRKEHKDRFELLRSYFTPEHQDKLVILSQDKEAELQAKSAYLYFKRAYGIENTIGATLGIYFLAAGSGRGSAQFTVLNAQGEIVDVFCGPGIPKGETEEQANQRKNDYETILVEINKKYEIGYAMFFDSMYHIIKDNAEKIIKDGDMLPSTPEEIPTMADFTPHYGFGEAITKAKTLVVRNFKLPSKNAHDDKIFKISFITGDYMKFDIGSGKGSLVDPNTEKTISGMDFDNWQTDDEDLYDIAVWMSIHGS